MKLIRTTIKKEEVELPIYFCKDDNYYMICEIGGEFPIVVLYCYNDGIYNTYYKDFDFDNFISNKKEIDKETFLKKYLKTESFLKGFIE